MTNNVEWEVTNMHMPAIASSLISSKTLTDAEKVLRTCWGSKKHCKPKVFIDGHVLFFGGFKIKLQYTSTFHQIGRVYDIQPGKRACVRAWVNNYFILFIYNFTDKI